jgi:hypothetical protein
VGTTRTVIVEHVSLLACTPLEAFDAVNSAELAPVIDPGVRSWTPDSTPIDVGTRFTVRARLGIIPIRGTTEAIRWDRPALAVYRSIRPSWPFSMTAEHRFEPHDGATRYSWRIDFHVLHPIARPVVWLTARLFRRAMARQAEALTAYVGR